MRSVRTLAGWVLFAAMLLLLTGRLVIGHDSPRRFAFPRTAQSALPSGNVCYGDPSLVTNLIFVDPLRYVRAL